jgi:hypothetical protein
MVLIGPAGSDADEWLCPSCGRRMVLRWPPRYEKLVLDRGDDSVAHVGGKGGVAMAGVGVAVTTSVPVGDRDRDWLDEIGVVWGEDTA